MLSDSNQRRRARSPAAQLRARLGGPGGTLEEPPKPTCHKAAQKGIGVGRESRWTAPGCGSGPRQGRAGRGGGRERSSPDGLHHPSGLQPDTHQVPS